MGLAEFVWHKIRIDIVGTCILIENFTRSSKGNIDGTFSITKTFSSWDIQKRAVSPFPYPIPVHSFTKSSFSVNRMSQPVNPD